MTSEDRAAVIRAIAPVIREYVAAEIAMRDTKIAILMNEISELKAVAPVPGPPGPPGERGETGGKGDPGVQGDKGDQGIKGDTGDRGDRGEKGDQGIAGRDGLPGVTGPVGDRGPQGDRGERGDRGEKGDTGDRGEDGLGFDDLDVVYDGERTLTHRYVRGERVKEVTVVFPVTIYRGVWTNETPYERGDQVSDGGSTWTALAASKGIKPGQRLEASRCWQLSSQRGRQGERGAKGDPGDRGPKGDQGERGPKGY